MVGVRRSRLLALPSKSSIYTAPSSSAWLIAREWPGFNPANSALKLAGMAFPLRQSIPLSALGKIGGAFCQYVLAKYLFSEYAREKMKDNEWMGKIDKSFKSHPFGVALIWRFSPLPEFVKNVGPSLVKTLKTRYQLMAILTHGLPFTILWSFMGAETAAVARGGEASVLLKRLVAIISSVGLFVSPTLFGMWLKGLGDDATSESQ